VYFPNESIAEALIVEIEYCPHNNNNFNEIGVKMAI
jgi:hypothetical protein